MADQTVELNLAYRNRWGFRVFMAMHKAKLRSTVWILNMVNPPMITWRIGGRKPETIRFRELFSIARR